MRLTLEQLEPRLTLGHWVSSAIPGGVDLVPAREWFLDGLDLFPGFVTTLGTVSPAVVAADTAEASLIEQAQRSLAASGQGTVIGIDFKDISSDAQSYIAQHQLSYPNLRDLDGSFATAYGTIALPETFVLDRRLQVVGIAREEIISESWLRTMIAKAERA